eukprot:CAMPEP_0175007664 /NCGR_PEP_ID=MMETSP0005-20121125/6544_1 /TAXON_ID=420556 /ORGANISM="Ochromonas sp., Strain CCMP1393" /LENGTH=87 /DNA_ID=CAMNT_0016263145 /DNA_START=191 /DNA_END=454 /DNA_ORIENTATION=+
MALFSPTLPPCCSISINKYKRFNTASEDIHVSFKDSSRIHSFSPLSRLSRNCGACRFSPNTNKNGAGVGKEFWNMMHVPSGSDRLKV